MKISRFFPVSFFSSLLFLAGLTVAHASLPIGTVNMNQLYENYEPTRNAMASFQDQGQLAVQQLRRLEEDLQEMQEPVRQANLDRNNIALSESRREAAEAEFNRLVREVRSKQEAMAGFRNEIEVINTRIRKHRELMMADITEIVTEVAENKGLLLVLDTSGQTTLDIPGVVYSSPTIDITDEVQRILQENL